jgi:hypothetical protein
MKSRGRLSPWRVAADLDDTLGRAIDPIERREWSSKSRPGFFAQSTVGRTVPLGARYLTSGFDVADASHGLTTIGEVPGQLRREG